MDIPLVAEHRSPGLDTAIRNLERELVANRIGRIYAALFDLPLSTTDPLPLFAAGVGCVVGACILPIPAAAAMGLGVGGLLSVSFSGLAAKNAGWRCPTFQWLRPR